MSSCSAAGLQLQCGYVEDSDLQQRELYTTPQTMYKFGAPRELTAGLRVKPQRRSSGAQQQLSGTDSRASRRAQTHL